MEIEHDEDFTQPEKDAMPPPVETRASYRVSVADDDMSDNTIRAVALVQLTDRELRQMVAGWAEMM